MFDKESSLGEGGKPMLVKAVVAKGAIEAFNESVLHRLSRLDVMKGKARRLSPEVKGFAGQLRAIVQSDDLWQGTGESEFFKHINASCDIYGAAIGLPRGRCVQCACG